MSKNIIWEFNQTNSTLSISDKSKVAELEQAFSFKLTRYKNSQTHEESLKIESFYKGCANGCVDTYIYRLDKDLKKLMRYGVAFSGILYADLQNEIEKIYLCLNTSEPINDSDAPKMVDNTIMEDVLSMIYEVINVFDLKDGYYNIPVEEFNLLIEESDFNIYDIKSIKRWFCDNKFIKCGTGRLTNLVRINKKPVRVISFKAEKLNSYIQKNNQNSNTERR